MNGGRPEINVRRNVYQVDAQTGDDRGPATMERPVRRRPRRRRRKHESARQRCWDLVRRTVPAVDWLLLNYKWSDDLMEDVAAGVTVAVLNIPQGMAYSILGNVEPTVGLYMAVIPVLVYSLLGTSRHVSLGVLSVICLMTGKVVATYAPDSVADADPDAVAGPYTGIQVATAVTLVTGLVQLLMYAFRLGALSAVLSETLVSGFTGSVAVIVVTSQLGELLGVHVARRRGPFQVLFACYDLANKYRDINPATATASAVIVTTLLVYNAWLKGPINRKLCIPLPIELLITIAATTLFHATTIAKDYGMVQMGEIRSGLPGFDVPPMDLYMAVLPDAIVIAVVAYSISMSLALLVSEQMRYPIDTNQELLAQGACNVISSFFSCLPCGASPSRSASQRSVGGKTQMASIVSAGIIIVVLLWVGAVFEPLPRCVLSSVIVVALKDLMMQACRLPRLWRESRSDAAVWLVTYVAVLGLDIDLGLLVGVAASLLVVSVRGALNDVHVLGRLRPAAAADLYVRTDLYESAVEVPGVKVLRYAGSLNVLNRFAFKRKVFEAIRDDVDDAAAAAAVVVVDADDRCTAVSVIGDGKTAADLPPRGHGAVAAVVLDLAALHYADAAGTKALCELIESLTSDGYDVSLAAVPETALDSARKRGLGAARIFPTVHDAVVFHQNR